MLFDMLMVAFILLKRVKLPFPACTMDVGGGKDFRSCGIFH